VAVLGPADDRRRARPALAGVVGSGAARQQFLLAARQSARRAWRHVAFHTRSGQPFNPTEIRGNTVLFGMDYGLKERLALDVKVAWVANRYRGNDLLHGPADTGRSHSTLQDARIALRYQLLPPGSWAITPLVGAVVPTHQYETRGHSAPGRHLKALQLGLGVGRDIAIGSRVAYLQGQYSYAIVERVENMYIDRSSADVELGVARATSISTSSSHFTTGSPARTSCSSRPAAPSGPLKPSISTQPSCGPSPVRTRTPSRA